MTTPLSLDDAQLGIVLAASARVPLCWRGRFFDGVLDRLLLLDAIGDDDVRSAVGCMFARIGIDER